MNEISKNIKEVLTTFNVTARRRVKSKNDFYAVIIKSGFDIISKLLKEGATFAALFDHLVESGILPENGNPDSLRRAYRREVFRRVSKAHDTKKNMGQKSQPAQTPQNISSREEEIESDTDRMNRIRKKLGSTTESASGRITKYADGTFDFD